MKSIKLFLLFLSIIVLNNCSHTHKVKIDAVASPDQMKDHKGVVTSEKKHVVSLAYYDLGMLNSKTKFKIIVENYGDKPIDFSTDNISVMFEGNSIDWSSKKIEIETPSDAMNDIQIELRMKLISTLQTTMPSAAHLGVSVGNVGRAEATKEILLMKMRKLGDMIPQSFYMIPRTIIRPQIIMPNESVSGIFVCDTSEMKDKLKGHFIISVRVDGEEHKFTFSRS